ncbi:MAG: hypothetical protein JWO05_292 [Gemmatimonadetes bacterium]|nr:hypothetical protein [Gemmatimonadota bacterium]
MRPLIVVAAALLLTPPAHAQAAPPAMDIAYRVSLADPAMHLYDVTIDLARLSGGSVDLQMPVWSPGRYARADFARNVQEVSVTGAKGDTLAAEKLNGSLWRVALGRQKAARVHYRVFANAPMSGTFSVLDTNHANWNGPSLFMYVVGHKQDAVTLHVDAPPAALLMNGDASLTSQRDFRFENYDRLVDTPTEVAGNLLLDSTRVDGRTYRVMVHHNGPVPEGGFAKFVRDVGKLVKYENSVFDAPPLTRYTFLVHLGFPGGDGMEHLFSTQVQTPQKWADTNGVMPATDIVAHEYFHVWNVKRVRPAALGPFDYTVEQYQPSLWVAEGWTQYYGTVAMHRAGITDEAEMLASVAGIARANLTAPGRKLASARMASFHAPFWDGAAQSQPTNRGNVWISYYTKGAGLALYLDLMVRSKTNDRKSLDDVFRALRKRSWEQRSASYYLQGRGYTERDVELAVQDVTGEDMHGWFDTHVGGTVDPDFDAALAGAGLKLVRGDQRWSIEPLPEATEAQRRVRAGWLSGSHSPPG